MSGAATVLRTPTRPEAVSERALLAAWLDRRLAVAVAETAPLPGTPPAPAFDLPGLSLSADGAFGLLGAPDPSTAVGEAAALWCGIEAAGGCFARLAQLGLDGPSLRCLALCLAPDLDGRYARVLGYLHDDLTRRRPNLPLLRQILDEDEVGAAFASDAPLRHLGLVAAIDGEASSALASLEPDPILCCALEGHIPGDLAAAIHAAPWGDAARAPEPEPEVVLAALGAGSSVVLLRVAGDGAAERRDWAEALLRRRGSVALRARPTGPPEVHGALGLGRRLALLAALQDDVLVLDLPAAWSVPEARTAVTALAMGLASLDRLSLILEETGATAEPLGGGRSRHVRLAPPSLAARRATWRSLVAERDLQVSPLDLDRLARLRLTRSAMEAAIAEAEGAIWPEAAPDGAALLAAARRTATVSAPRLARRIPPEASLDRLVLPADRLAQVREIVAQLRYAERVQGAWGFAETMPYGRGVTALFAGPSGTGKTLAARAIAGELGLDLLQVDLAQVVSKYIGETEKNLSAAFAAAEAGEVALLFDEADALFGKRSDVKDAHDRYANIETAYLLQRLEEFAGLAILTTNLKLNLDTAFLRRLRFVVDFPRPDAALRLALWRRAFPSEAPLDPDLDLPLLAERLDLTGGSIQSAALRSAYLAASEDRPIAFRDAVHACRRELLKLGQLSAERELAELAEVEGAA